MESEPAAVGENNDLPLIPANDPLILARAVNSSYNAFSSFMNIQNLGGFMSPFFRCSCPRHASSFNADFDGDEVDIDNRQDIMNTFQRCLSTLEDDPPSFEDLSN